jgi:hypothetical protein
MNSPPDWLSVRDDLPGAPLRYISYLLAASRLQVRTFTQRGETVAIAVTNTQDAGNGRVSVRYDGRMTWTHNRDIETLPGIENTRNMIISMLTAGAPGTDMPAAGD